MRGGIETHGGLSWHGGEIQNDLRSQATPVLQLTRYFDVGLEIRREASVFARVHIHRDKGARYLHKHQGLYTQIDTCCNGHIQSTQRGVMFSPIGFGGDLRWGGPFLLLQPKRAVTIG